MDEHFGIKHASALSPCVESLKGAMSKELFTISLL